MAAIQMMNEWISFNPTLTDYDRDDINSESDKKTILIILQQFDYGLDTVNNTSSFLPELKHLIFFSHHTDLNEDYGFSSNRSHLGRLLRGL